ncbi:helix-turn-helix transcriptional regulator [Clostridium sp. YIM B02555]|uniref:helix-turn-helix domain-containing protein n=1 Tax=Clostridium sp. YIM B02555 TaxID=2911968 RepID=UPI001EEE3BF1|nr:helix-turn-helix transcriptional regulator [Clostridium sp. YIM B02555]
MFDNIIMTQGEKIKELRSMLKISQDEITYGICSRTNLSKIENEIQNLSFNLANSFAERFNNIIEEKGLDIKPITAHFLLKNENEQANNIFSNILKNIKEEEMDIDKKLREAETLMDKYDIVTNDKIELYKFLADAYYNKYQYIKSNEMCNKGIKICIKYYNVKEEVTFYIYKSMNSVKTFNYREALKELEYAELLNKNIQNSVYETILYQKGLVYKKMYQYDNALKYFKILIDKPVKDKILLIKAKMVYANCLMDQFVKFEEAEKEYFEILDLASGDRDFTALAYKNLSELYYNQKRYRDAGRYIKNAQIPNNEYLNEILFFAAKVFRNLNEDVEHYLLDSLKVCEEKDRENTNLIKNIIDELVLLYIKKNDEDNLLLIADKAKELNINYCLSYLRILEYYRGRNDEKSIEFSNKLMDKLS